MSKLHRYPTMQPQTHCHRQTIGVAVLPACVTVTLISDIIPESCVIVIIAVPVCVPAVITPFTTVATFHV